MSKIVTPAMEQYAKKHKKVRKYSAARESWKRFKRNRTALLGLTVLALLILMAIFAKWIAPYEFQEQIIADAYQGPSLKHLFGTDHMGRDLLCIRSQIYPVSRSNVCPDRDSGRGYVGDDCGIFRRETG